MLAGTRPLVWPGDTSELCTTKSPTRFIDNFCILQRFYIRDFLQKWHIRYFGP